jgi:uncharacterized FlgJ-related protein
MELYRFNKETLDYETVRTPWVWRTLFVISCLFLLSFTFAEREYVPTEVIVFKETKTEEEIFEMVDRMPFKYKDIVKAQILIETGHFKDEVFKHNNNLFGMRLAKQRLTLATGDNLKHAVFETVEESLYDRLIYEAMYLNKLNREQYFSFLDRLYAEGEGYSTRLKQIIKNNKL